MEATDKLMGLESLFKHQKQNRVQQKVEYFNPNQPFIKVRGSRTEQRDVPFHKGFQRCLSQGKFCTGSNYSGTYDSLGFSGHGVYQYPHGVRYEGEFRNGQFHGKGSLIYPKGQKAEGTWYKGKLLRHKFRTHGIIFKPNEFLEFPNRTNKEEMDENGEVNLTEEALTASTEQIPVACFDTADGYYDPNSRIIYYYDNAMKRIATEEERKLIHKNYRQNNDYPVSYLPELFEYWTSGRKREIAKIREETMKSEKMSQKSSLEEIDNSLYSLVENK